MKILKLNQKTVSYITLAVDKRLLLIMTHVIDGVFSPKFPIIFKGQLEINAQLIDSLLDKNILPPSFKECDQIYHSFFRDNKEIVENLSDWFVNEYLKGGCND